MPREHLLKIGAAGVRGVVGEFLTPNVACAFAQAYGTYIGAGRVLVGRDTRTTGEMLQHAVHCGLLAAGCEVVDAGIVPTPTLQIYIAATRARGGIALTASHNPPEYNALKLFNGRGLFLNQYERSELVDLYHQSDFVAVPNENIRSIITDHDSAPRLHFSRVLRHVDVEGIRSKRFRVGLDSVNGAGSVMSPQFLADRLGCDLKAIFIDPTRLFPRVPEPKPETLGEISRLVVEQGCSVGFAQDPDGDRLAVIDEKGRVLDSDDVVALAVLGALERLPGDVVVNLTTSQSVDDIARAHGRKVFRTPVGEANLVEMLQAIPAAIGGEGQSGGIIFPAVHLCRDSYMGMAVFLDRMARTGQSISEMVEGLPRYYRKIGKVAFQHGRLGGVMQELAERHPEASTDRTDGLKLCWPDKWVHVRASNTEPILRFAAEAKTTEELERLYEELGTLVRA